VRYLYQYPGVAETVDLAYIKEHYYRSHESVNPNRFVPKGPIMDLFTPMAARTDRAEPRSAVYCPCG
jgi:putative glutathione S-transferase